MQSIIVNRLYTPIKLIDSAKSTKFEKEWDKTNKKLTQLNTKAMNILYCTLDVNEFNYISTYIFAKKI